MRPPNPLNPQGALQQQGKSKSAVRIAVLSIVAVHALFFAGLLSLSFVQGCGGKEPTPTTPAPESNNVTDIPPITTNLPDSFSISNPLPIVEIPVTPPIQTPIQTPPSEVEYVIVKGDMIGTIASKHGVTVAAITNANPNLVATRLVIGSKIHIPAPTSTTPRTPRADVPAGEITTHVVKGGENLTKIAASAGITVKALKDLNGLKTDRINVGDKLKVPSAAAPRPIDSVPAASSTPAPAASSGSSASSLPPINLP